MFLILLLFCWGFLLRMLSRLPSWSGKGLWSPRSSPIRISRSSWLMGHSCIRVPPSSHLMRSAVLLISLHWPYLSGESGLWFRKGWKTFRDWVSGLSWRPLWPVWWPGLWPALSSPAAPSSSAAKKKEAKKRDTKKVACSLCSVIR